MTRFRVPSSAWTVRSLLREGARRLASSGCDQARQEAEWLLSRLLGLPRVELYLREQIIPARTEQRFFGHVRSRCGGRPLQHLLGETEFFGERLAVGPRVFIPRPETEVIVEAALEALRPLARRRGTLRLLDLGSGSGCIALSLARRLAACTVVGVELSWNALRIARRNASQLGLTQRVQWVRGSWGEALRGVFDGIVSNPPYVPSAAVRSLPPPVRREPRASLDGGPDGMGPARRVLEHGGRLLAPEGVLALECGETQVAVLARAARALGWVEQASPLHDLAGRPRGVLVTRAP